MAREFSVNFIGASWKYVRDRSCRIRKDLKREKIELVYIHQTEIREYPLSISSPATKKPKKMKLCGTQAFFKKKESKILKRATYCDSRTRNRHIAKG